MPKILSNLLLLLSLLVVPGCYSTTSETVISNDLSSGYTFSEPIYLSFRNTKGASFYFLLAHKTMSDEYFLRVRWANKKSEAKLFNGLNSNLIFLVDSVDIIDLYPVKAPRTIAFNLETKSYEEEAMFMLTKEQIEKINNAKSVTAELRGRNITVIGKFNKYHTFRAFRNFIKSEWSL